MRTFPFRWDGDVMFPIRPKEADREFVVGQVYHLAVEEPRSQASHRHYFAAVKEAWVNLPEDVAPRFGSPEHLRKWALIQAGYFEEKTIVTASPADADRLAVLVRAMDEYAVVTVRGAVVQIYTAKSQSVRSMTKQDFQESKDAVLRVVAGMIGVSPDQLENEGAAA